ncbi:MAG: lipoyl synthase [Gaiellales bacterium]|nr:lipoyl synthase [Gaiellales bacterium]
MPWGPEAKNRPAWMRVRSASPGSRFDELTGIVREAGLHTVCEEAGCPNIGECWGRGTATFQILGDTCTRACRYCAVNSAKGGEDVDPLEPAKVAAAAQRMGLRHVVVTSVDRDDLPDKGAGHWAQTIRALRRRNPELQVEVLVPDFLGREDEAMLTVLEAEPHVYNHNIETVRRIQPKVRIKGDYDRALHILRRAGELWTEHFPERGPLLTKSGIIVGMGETDDEVIETLRDLRAYDVDVVTIGQYLQPSERHLPLDRWVPLESFRRFREAGMELGFGSVFAGPLVRSSYRAEEQRLAAEGGSRVVAY